MKNDFLSLAIAELGRVIDDHPNRDVKLVIFVDGKEISQVNLFHDGHVQANQSTERPVVSTIDHEAGINA